MVCQNISLCLDLSLYMTSVSCGKESKNNVIWMANLAILMNMDAKVGILKTFYGKEIAAILLIIVRLWLSLFLLWHSALLGSSQKPHLWYILYK